MRLLCKIKSTNQCTQTSCQKYQLSPPETIVFKLTAPRSLLNIWNYIQSKSLYLGKARCIRRLLYTMVMLAQRKIVRRQFKASPCNHSGSLFKGKKLRIDKSFKMSLFQISLYWINRCRSCYNGCSPPSPQQIHGIFYSVVEGSGGWFSFWRNPCRTPSRASDWTLLDQGPIIYLFSTRQEDWWLTI